MRKVDSNRIHPARQTEQIINTKPSSTNLRSLFMFHSLSSFCLIRSYTSDIFFQSQHLEQHKISLSSQKKTSRFFSESRISFFSFHNAPPVRFWHPKARETSTTMRQAIFTLLRPTTKNQTANSYVFLCFRPPKTFCLCVKKMNHHQKNTYIFHQRRRAGCPDFYKSWEECPFYRCIIYTTLYFAKIYVIIYLTKKAGVVYGTDNYSKTSDFGKSF